MRPLTDDEQRQVLKKLDFFIGTNVAKLIDRSDGTYCFRLHKERVFYAHQKLMQAACTVPGDALGSFGVCIGKFTKSRKFRLHVTAVDYIAPYSKNKVWLKAGSEQAYTFGNHVLKSGISRVSEEMEPNQGVIVLSHNDQPVGFGVSTKGTAACRTADPHVIMVLHQADVGEYLRSEEHLV